MAGKLFTPPCKSSIVEVINNKWFLGEKTKTKANQAINIEWSLGENKNNGKLTMLFYQSNTKYDIFAKSNNEDAM